MERAGHYVSTSTTIVDLKDISMSPFPQNLDFIRVACTPWVCMVWLCTPWVCTFDRVVIQHREFEHMNGKLVMKICIRHHLHNSMSACRVCRGVSVCVCVQGLVCICGVRVWAGRRAWMCMCLCGVRDVYVRGVRLRVMCVLSKFHIRTLSRRNSLKSDPRIFPSLSA